MRKTVLAAVLAGTMFFTATAAQAGGWHGYGHGGYGYGHHHHNGLGIALGVTGAFLGTAILVDALSRPRYVAPAPAYYYPPPPVYYQSPPVASAPASDAYAAGYSAGVAEGQRYEQGCRTTFSDDAPYYGR